MIDIIEKEIGNRDFNASYIADRMTISTSQLSRKLNQITGLPTASYILQVRLLRTKRVLTDNPDSNLSEISDSCGFYDLSYFSRMFKKEFGISPSQFKKDQNAKKS